VLNQNEYDPFSVANTDSIVGSPYYPWSVNNGMAFLAARLAVRGGAQTILMLLVAGCASDDK